MQTITHQKVRAHCLHHHRLKLTMKNVKVKNYAKKNAIDLLLTFTNSRMNLVKYAINVGLLDKVGACNQFTQTTYIGAELCYSTHQNLEKLSCFKVKKLIFFGQNSQLFSPAALIDTTDFDRKSTAKFLYSILTYNKIQISNAIIFAHV